MEIQNSAGKKIASSERSFSHYYTTMIDYTVNWDTAGYTPGEYKVVVSKYFYSFMEWRETPTKTTYRITLRDPSTRPTDGWKNENMNGWMDG